jgi:uncharacterized protein HemX
MAKLKIPAKTTISLSWKRIGLIALIVLVIAAAIFLVVTGQWKTLQNLLLKVRMKDRQIKIAKIQAQQDANTDKLDEEKELRDKLQAEQKQLEKEELETQLEIEGMSHEEIVATMRTRGY